MEKGFEKNFSKKVVLMISKCDKNIHELTDKSVKKQQKKKKKVICIRNRPKCYA